MIQRLTEMVEVSNGSYFDLKMWNQRIESLKSTPRLIKNLTHHLGRCLFGLNLNKNLATIYGRTPGFISPIHKTPHYFSLDFPHYQLENSSNALLFLNAFMKFLKLVQGHSYKSR